MRAIRRARLAAVLVAALAIPAGLVVAVPGTASASAACGTRPASDRDSKTGTGAAWSNIRTGTSTGCNSYGLAAPSDSLNYWCWTWAGEYTWTYLHDNNTGKQGWVRDDTLPDDGSGAYCGF
jgi:hypothetical protein